MEVFLGRQPIFNAKKQVVAYEILYRSGNHNAYDVTIDGDTATTSVVIDALLNFGVTKLTSGRRVYINFTKKLIMDNLPTLFNPKELVIEILESTEIDDAFVEKCKEFKSKGYSIALDDYIGDAKFEAIMPYVDILKVDFMLLGKNERQSIAKRFSTYGKMILLAEKVETLEDFNQGMAFGYHLFQGYFFERPVICKGKSVDVSTYRYMEVLKETMTEEPDFNKLTNIVKNDFSLSYKLLRLINSPAFYTIDEITSISHALTLLGINEIRKWVTLIMLRDLSSEKPNELMRVSLTRALFAEKLAGAFGIKERATEAFLLGMFSLIDTIMDKPIFEVIDPLPIKEDLKGALLGENNVFHHILLLLKNYEMGNWTLIEEFLESKALTNSELNILYLDSVEESHKLFMET